MGSQDQQSQQRRSLAPLATDSGTEAAGESCLSYTASHMATGGGCSGSSPPLMVVPACDVFDESIYEGSEATPPPPLWADVPADILGSVLRLLPCVADRASMRSVCRHWRAAARVQALSAPLPVLVLPRFRFSCLTSDGSLTVPRRSHMPVEVAGDDVQIVSSCDDWLMVSRPSWRSKESGAECFLVHAFSNEVVRLPCLQHSPCCYNLLDESNSGHRIQRFFNGTKEKESTWVVLSNALLSASPSSGSKYIVAALCYHIAEPGLALWRPGMTTWCLYRSTQIDRFKGNLAFYMGKLYVLWSYTADILAFELRDDEHGVSLCCPNKCKIHPLVIASNPMGWRKCNMVVWRGKLLLIIRLFSNSSYKKMECKPHNVEVFALDFSRSPCGATQIHNFDGDCIFLQKSGCRPFSAGLNVGVQGDLIYFSDGSIGDHFPYAYNMRDGTVRHFAAGPPEGCIGFWIFPSS